MFSQFFYVQYFCVLNNALFSTLNIWPCIQLDRISSCRHNFWRNYEVKTFLILFSNFHSICLNCLFTYPSDYYTCSFFIRLYCNAIFREPDTTRIIDIRVIFDDVFGFVSKYYSWVLYASSHCKLLKCEVSRTWRVNIVLNVLLRTSFYEKSKMRLFIENYKRFLIIFRTIFFTVSDHTHFLNLNNIYCNYQ